MIGSVQGFLLAKDFRPRSIRLPLPTTLAPRIRITFPSAAPSSALFAAFLYASLYLGGRDWGLFRRLDPRFYEKKSVLGCKVNSLVFPWGRTFPQMTAKTDNATSMCVGSRPRLILAHPAHSSGMGEKRRDGPVLVSTMFLYSPPPPHARSPGASSFYDWMRRTPSVSCKKTVRSNLCPVYPL
jgi:hypothetical protein